MLPAEQFRATVAGRRERWKKYQGRPDVEQFLVPTLRAGDVVIMDNLSSHKRSVIRQAIRAAGAKLKHLLRKADERTADAIWQRIGSLLDAFTPTNARTTSSTPDMRQCDLIRF